MIQPGMVGIGTDCILNSIPCGVLGVIVCIYKVTKVTSYDSKTREMLDAEIKFSIGERPGFISAELEIELL
jgi:hypothetical protein